MPDNSSEPYGPNRQATVFTQGMLADERPEHPISYDELKHRAHETMSPEARAYVAGGAGTEDTMAENERAFERFRIVPRVLRDVSERDLSVEMFDRKWPVPVMLAPIGSQSILHEEGELATARAAAALDVPMCLSSVSSETIEDVGEAHSIESKWFQLYWGTDDDLAVSFIERAEAAGYDGIVLTVDTPMTGWREREIEHAYLPALDGDGVANYLSDPVFRDGLDQSPEENEEAALMQFVNTFGDASHTFEDLSTIREATDLPIVLKGILHPNDARAAVEHGMDGVVVSNHGGRQVDGEIGALTALPNIVEAIGDTPVLFDSGVRGGADVVKALALGANSVLLGRPYAYGLALDGEEGVRSVLKNFLADLDLTLALTGHTSFDDLDRSVLVDHRPPGVAGPQSGRLGRE
jgi:lactate 2-monooxygenase